jgi:DNA-binding XRE family transcriptional regulator
MTISSAQCRAARAMLELDQATLAAAANVSRNTIVSFERGQRIPNINNLLAIQATLEAEGIEFLMEPDGTQSISLRPMQDYDQHLA